MRKINFENYWSFIDDKFDNLLEDGFIKFPTIESLNLVEIDTLISAQVSNKTYTELEDEHKKFIEKLELEKYLAPRLFKFAKEKFNYKGVISNKYHIARSAKPGDNKYRAHFDSHIFTLVIPITIPETPEDRGPIGELIFFPATRKFPQNPITDFFGKLWFRQYSSKAGIEKLSKKITINKNSFRDYQPLLFLGNTVFHSNQPISKYANSNRLTLLAHYFDPFPRFGIGNLLRKLRFR